MCKRRAADVSLRMLTWECKADHDLECLIHWRAILRTFASDFENMEQTIATPLNQRYRPIATVNYHQHFSIRYKYPLALSRSPSHLHGFSLCFSYFPSFTHSPYLLHPYNCSFSVARTLVSLNPLVAIRWANETVREREKKLISEIPHIFFRCPERCENIPFESLLSNYLAI